MTRTTFENGRNGRFGAYNTFLCEVEMNQKSACFAVRDGDDLSCNIRKFSYYFHDFVEF